jgi:hypothetical protein
LWQVLLVGRFALFVGQSRWFVANQCAAEEAKTWANQDSEATSVSGSRRARARARSLVRSRWWLSNNNDKRQTTNDKNKRTALLRLAWSAGASQRVENNETTLSDAQEQNRQQHGTKRANERTNERESEASEHQKKKKTKENAFLFVLLCCLCALSVGAQDRFT